MREHIQQVPLSESMTSWSAHPASPPPPQSGGTNDNRRCVYVRVKERVCVCVVIVVGERSIPGMD